MIKKKNKKIFSVSKLKIIIIIILAYMEMMLDQEGDGFINECIYEDAEPSTSRNLDNQNQSPEVLSSSEQSSSSSFSSSSSSSSSADTDTDVDNDNQHDQSKKKFNKPRRLS